MPEPTPARFALAVNAVAPVLNAAGHWLPLSVREAVALAVLTAADQAAASPGAARTTTSDGEGCDCAPPPGGICVHDVTAPAPEPGLREHAAVTLTVTVRASTTVEAEHWAHTIRDLAVAEYGQTMRLETSLSAGTPAVRDAELHQLREELARCRDRFATQAENGAALALDLGAAEAALARVREFADQDQDGLCCSHVTGELRTLLKSLAPQDPS